MRWWAVVTIALTLLTPAAHADDGRRVDAGLAAGGVGAAALAAGAALLFMAHQTSDGLTASAQRHDFWDSASASSGRAYDIAGAVLISVGGAAIVAGTVVAVVSPRRAR
jgi:hypothetical protein